MQKKLSKIAENLTGQPMFALLAKAQWMEQYGKRILHFEIGDTTYPSPPNAVAAAKKALDDGITHYVNSMGMVELRETIADYTKKNWGFKPSINQILICPANAVIDFVIRCVANPGDDIIYPDPGFPTYYSAINYNGMTPVNVQLKKNNKFRLNYFDVKKKITQNTKLIIMNSPSNPTGAVMTKDAVIKMARLAKNSNVYLLSDEVYSEILFNKKHHSPCIVDKCKDYTLLLNSFSKNYSMSGWRLGYIIGPEELIAKMGLLLQTIFSCIPPFIQLGGEAVLSAIYPNEGVKMWKFFEVRRNLVCEGLNKLDHITCQVPDGAFYAFPDITKTGMSGIEYCDRLLRSKGVCLLPGECFGQYGKGHVRICFASTSLYVFEKALKKMAEFHKEF